MGGKMFIRINSPHCKKPAYHDVVVKSMEFKLTFNDDSQMLSYLINNMEAENTITEEKIASLVLQELKSHVYDGITVNELCRALKECFGVVAVYCCGIIQRFKLEMGMYWPDRVHLYFVEC